MRLTSVSTAKAECVHCGLRSRFTDLTPRRRRVSVAQGTLHKPRSAAVICLVGWELSRRSLCGSHLLPWP